jgi:hypothetical protein
MLAERGLVAEWTGDFGILGTRGTGGFLPKRFMPPEIIGGIGQKLDESGGEDGKAPNLIPSLWDKGCAQRPAAPHSTVLSCRFVPLCVVCQFLPHFQPPFLSPGRVCLLRIRIRN